MWTINNGVVEDDVLVCRLLQEQHGPLSTGEVLVDMEIWEGR